MTSLAQVNANDITHCVGGMLLDVFSVIGFASEFQPTTSNGYPVRGVIAPRV